MFFVQINHTGKGFLFLIFREIKLRKYSSLHKIFYGLDFSVANIKKDKYLRYNLYRYIFILNLDHDYEVAIKGCKTAMQLYPFDASFFGLYTSILIEMSDIADYKTLKIITGKLKEYQKNMELVHEESQGNEGILDVITVKLLMKLRYYNNAKELVKKIDCPIYEEQLDSEKKLFDL
ncbi:hypothetical protein [uncultured Lactobacillus sp.]|uniref:hypothetical protein n=1 Tax=uncultured Lactobacillus sp. TaxID=153152 RepID=UPI002605F020|nr:hypothetical protein [uncultured Lactobacillus sp.]